MTLTPPTERALEACYDATLAAELWPQALQLLVESIGGLSGAFHCHTPQPATITLPRSSAHQAYSELWTRNQEFAPDPHINRCGRLYALGRRFLVEHDVSTEEERRTIPHYRETARPSDREWYAGVGFSVDGNVWCLPTYRGVKQGPVTRKEGRYLAELGPHLARLVRLAQRFAANNLVSGLSILGQLNYAALAIDARGIAIDLNHPAAQLLGKDFNLRAGRPVAGDPMSDRRLQQFIAAAMAAERSATLPGEPAVIVRNETPWLVADAMPVTSFGNDFFSGARFILVLTDMTVLSVPDETRLRMIFSLSAAEGKLAKTLAAGHGIEAAANSLSISRETARTQLSAIFAKTNTKRQAELSALLARVSRPTRS
jgi:DNA-binding CsgD family transcriptional regulator